MQQQNVFIARAKRKGANSNRLFIRRLIMLLIIGMIHHLFKPGEALLPYAIFGFILLPFYKLKPRVNLAASFGFLLAGIFLFYMFDILAMFLLGLYVGQIHVFEKIDNYMSVIKKIQWISLIVTPMVIYLHYTLFTTNYYDSGSGLAGIVMGALYVTTFIRLVQNKRIQQLFTPLKHFGQMALTNYLGQTFIILSVVSLFNLKENVTVSESILFCIGIYFVQMVSSTIWLKCFEMGPVEQ